MSNNLPIVEWKNSLESQDVHVLNLLLGANQQVKLALNELFCSIKEEDYEDFLNACKSAKNESGTDKKMARVLSVCLSASDELRNAAVGVYLNIAHTNAAFAKDIYEALSMDDRNRLPARGY